MTLVLVPVDGKYFGSLEMRTHFPVMSKMWFNPLQIRKVRKIIV